MEFENLDLQLGPRLGDGLQVRLRSPEGEAESRMQFPASPAGSLPQCADPAGVGGALFEALFQGEVRDLFHACLRRGGEHLGLRLRLQVDPRHPDLAPLHRTPWELLYRQATHDFLALGRRTPVVRYLDLQRPTSVKPFRPPLGVLLVRVLDPRDRLLDLDRETDELRRRLAADPAIKVEVQEDPEPQAVREMLLDRPFHVLHYMGHGAFNPETGAGALLFQMKGRRAPLAGRHLAIKLGDLRSLRLVVLNACDTARAGGEAGQNPFAGVATALVQAGVPAVVAMQSPIDDRSAAAFSAAFYGRLARRRSLEEAMTEGRQAIHSLEPRGAAWAVPVLFLRSTEVFPAERRQEVAAPTSPAPSPASLPARSGPGGLALGAGLAASLAVTLALTPRLADLFQKADGPEVRSAVPTEAKPLSSEPPGPTRDPIPQHRAAGSSPASPPPAERAFSVGEGKGRWTFHVTADRQILDAFLRALREAATPLPGFGMPGQSVSIQIPAPRIERSNAAGLPSMTCSLLAHLRLEADTFSVPASLEQSDAHTACEMAAQLLAKDVANRLAQP